MLILLLLLLSLSVVVGASPTTGFSTSNHNPDVPAFLYSTVTSFAIQTNVRPNSRALQALDPSKAPYGSHIELSFGIEGRLARNYTKIMLELNQELFSNDYVVTLDGQPITSAGVNTAYKTKLPNNMGWARVTLVPNHPDLFHAFIFHAEEEDMVVVEPLQTSELSRTTSLHDPTHRDLRRLLNNKKKETMVAYLHSQDAHPDVQSDTASTWHKTRRVLKAMAKRRRKKQQQQSTRFLGNAMGVPLQEQVTTYKGPYGTAPGCPATVQKMTMGLAADAGFYTGVSGTAASSGADVVAAYINNMINVANVIYVDQFNVFLSIGEYLMYSSTSSSPTFSGGDWNQQPHDITQSAGSARGDWGCHISRYEQTNHGINGR
jgi:hypothetical protein